MQTDPPASPAIIRPIPFGERLGEEPYNASEVVFLGDSRFLFCDNNVGAALFELRLAPTAGWRILSLEPAAPGQGRARSGSDPPDHHRRAGGAARGEHPGWRTTQQFGVITRGTPTHGLMVWVEQVD